MLHFICTTLGVLIVYYELRYIGLRVVFQYSGWFLICTTLLHTYQIVFKPPSFISYVLCVIGILIVFPAAIPLLLTFDNTLASYLLYDLGNHVILPLCTIFHLNQTVYYNITNSILLLIVYNTIWVIIIENFASPKPYGILEDLNLDLRILVYIGSTMVGILGLLVLSILPCISKDHVISV